MLDSKKCEICGRLFTPHTTRQRACSKVCIKALNNKLNHKPDCDPFRPTTSATKILVERYWLHDGYSARQIAYELHRDVSVIIKIMEEIEHDQR